jgi:predicted acetyltransferase
MSTRIVEPTEAHREQIAGVLSVSINFPLERALLNAPLLKLEDIRVALRDDRVIATAGEFRFDQWFGGRAVGCCGITRVGTLPEHRADGLATACTDALLTRARDRGAPVAALFPAVLRPYRRLGFEVAGSYTDHRIALDAIATDPEAPGVELVDVDRDLAPIRDAYRAWVRGQHGAVEPVEDQHWRDRILTKADDSAYRAVVVREAGVITGFAAFTRVADPGPLDVGFGLSCNAFFATTPTAQRGLLAYFRGFRGLGKWLEWSGPPSDPLALASPEGFLSTPFRYDWMLRLLDVPAALEARGYPPIDADAVIAVDDARWPENAGPWRIRVRDGVAEVTATDDSSPRPIAIGILSSMFSGFLRIPDAVRLGVVDGDDPSLPALDAMFSGPDPWCPFFF